MPYTFLDLFAGAGGFTLGMEAAGLLSVGAVEIDSAAAKTLESNFGHRPLDFTGPDKGDIRCITGEGLLRSLGECGIDGLDLLIASPPCQGFSKVGRGKLDFLARKRGAFASDERNGLYEHAIRLLGLLRPRVFLFENVTGIMHLRSRNVAEDICEAVSEVGYVPKCTVLNSVWYGVPQIRERVIIMGVREDLGLLPEFPLKKFRIPNGTVHCSDIKYDRETWRNDEFFIDPATLGTSSRTEPAVSVGMAFDDLPGFTDHLVAQKTGKKYRSLRTHFAPVDYAGKPKNWYTKRMRHWNKHLMSDQVTDHFCRWTPRDFGTFAMMLPGDKYKNALAVAKRRYCEAVKDYEEGRRATHPWHNEYIPPYPDDAFNEKWRKLIKSQPSWTITAHLSKDTYSHIHFDSKQARAITIREAARIQSIPDAFRLEGNMGDAFRQIGNAVPPLMAKAIGEVVLEMLEELDCPTGLPAVQRAS